MDNADAKPLTREALLLVLCASPASNQEEKICALANENMDWELLLRLARAHAVTQLLFWRLKSAGLPKLPAALEAAFHENVRHNLWLTRELLQLHELFRCEEIPLLPFKGPTLALAAYGNLALRQFVDLDLLVPKSDALRARDLLLANGYRSTLHLSPRREQDYLDVYDEFVLCSGDGRCLVELHWAILPRKFCVSLETSAIWGRAESICLGGSNLPTLGLEDLLLVLCLHGTKHCWSYLSLVADIAWLIASRPEVKWHVLLERARAIGSLRMVLLGLKLASSLLHAPLPESLLHEIKSDRAVGALATQVAMRLFSVGDQSGRILRAGNFHMKVRERWKDRALYLYRLTTTPGVEDWRIADLPQGLAFVYPLLRYPRLLGKYWLRVP
jgi:hypothetical protein